VVNLLPVVTGRTAPDMLPSPGVIKRFALYAPMTLNRVRRLFLSYLVGVVVFYGYQYAIVNRISAGSYRIDLRDRERPVTAAAEIRFNDCILYP